MKCIVLSLVLFLLVSTAHAQVVNKTAESFEFGGWNIAEFNTVNGKLAYVDSAAPESKSKRSLAITPSYTGSFGGFGVAPAKPLVIPGETKSVTVLSRAGDPRHGLKIEFTDGWGRTSVNNQPLQFEIPAGRQPNWQKDTFNIPADWVQPVGIARISTNNWNTKGETNSPTFLVDQIDVQTDLSRVDPKTGALTTWKPEPNPIDKGKALKQSPRVPLLDVQLSTPVQANVFTDEPRLASVRITNWTAHAVTAKASFRITGGDEKKVREAEHEISVESVSGVDLPLEVERYGLYSLASDITFSNGQSSKAEMAFALMPKQPPLTGEQKMNSPYGLNYHGGGRLMIGTFRKAGIVWFREYAFSKDHLMQAKGDDGKYAGWPFFTRMMQAYADNDALVVACLQRWMTPPKIENGKSVTPLGPNQKWTQDLAHVLLAFPQIKYWEAGNEYDLNQQNARAEAADNWRNYQLYHAKLAELVKLLVGNDGVTVENGRAGIFPELVEDCVRSGLFAGVDVINSHHYCGTDAPEVNFFNFNTGSEERAAKKPSMFFDELRATKRAGQVDGKKRQHWLTEFGWDTKAGKVVSHYEQAVYLQRAWMLTLAAGCEKAFWFFHFDSPDANNFFDGCGLLTHDAQPKLALCAMAGMTSILPSPKYLGPINAGDNTAGHVFEQDGKLVASLFSIEGDDGPAVQLPAEAVYDYLGNRIDGTSVKLSMAPVYAVGLDRSSNFFKQSAYSLASPNLEAVTAGDRVTPVIELAAHAPPRTRVRASLNLPEGWTSQEPRIVEADGAMRIELPFVVPLSEQPRLTQAKVLIQEAGKEIKHIPLQLLIQPAMSLQVSGLRGEPAQRLAQSNVQVKIRNQSTQPRGGKIRLRLPESWQAQPEEIQLEALKPGELRELTVPVAWDTNWSVSNPPRVELELGSGEPITAYILPGTVRLHRAKEVKLDGELNDWPESTELPAWMLGSTFGPANAKVYLAWSPEGIYGAVQATDTKLMVQTPQTFWSGDTLELFIDTQNNKTARAFDKTDHQFWLIPQPDQNRVYVGRWKRAAEIPATQYDLPGIKSAARRTADGYQMEFLIPAEQLSGFEGAAGKKLGINLNLTVQGKRSTREVFWPRSKASDAPGHPEVWGTVELAD